MRKIKFRVFVKDELFPKGKIYYPGTLTEIDENRAFVLNQFGDLVHTRYVPDESGSVNHMVMTQVDFHDISVMQYTGLLDHNGKEIYEGDIISTDFQKNAVVSFDNGCFMVGGKRGISIDHYLNSGLEVIGNIHENPELLT